ncbi:ParA family protein [Inquilinus sp. Marseille-Q2685]|uniref:ParA family protein n=1 Tax=Inquilinus sp. Marseille-Q2685 TaxID=2866581 RepID=UPI001CE3B692|nr:AAA family ATPase [Inquilinus sp. Marseille-Q2685]
MKSIAFFNNKGGVGKTTLVYHLASMFSDLGVRVIAADYDPQANLTAMCLDEDRLAAIENDEIDTIYDVASPLIAEGKNVPPKILEIDDNFGLIAGDLDLSGVEDSLSSAWGESLGGSNLTKRRAFQDTTFLARAVETAGREFQAVIALIDIGPNLGAINRSALIGADYVVVPVAPDLFSLKGLTNVGRGIQEWRDGWKKRIDDYPTPETPWPNGKLEPLGYVISRFSTYAGEHARYFRRWIDRVPTLFHRDILRQSNGTALTVENDPAKLAWLKDYRSLMPMAQEVRKPIFKLRPADGAIGGHQQAVGDAYDDFEQLAKLIASKVGISI